MNSENIGIFLRARPHSSPTSRLELDVEQNLVRVSADTDDEHSLSGARNSRLEFRFDQVFGPRSSQTDIFMRAIQPSIDQVLSGYNSAVLAYGQTVWIACPKTLVRREQANPTR